MFLSYYFYNFPSIASKNLRSSTSCSARNSPIGCHVCCLFYVYSFRACLERKLCNYDNCPAEQFGQLWKYEFAYIFIIFVIVPGGFRWHAILAGSNPRDQLRNTVNKGRAVPSARCTWLLSPWRSSNAYHCPRSGIVPITRTLHALSALSHATDRNLKKIQTDGRTTPRV